MPRQLDEHECCIVARVLAITSHPCADGLRATLAATTVQVDGRTFLRLASTAPRIHGCPDGPTAAGAFIYGEDGTPDGEYLVWVKDGRLTGLEYGWFTDAAPRSLPAAERVEPRRRH